jgi:RHS repeat-associated protein
MRYNRTHGIVTKQQIHVVTNLYTNVAEATENAYTGQYQYANTSQPHTVSSITKTIPGGGSQLVSLDYDANGNLIKENTSTGNSSFDRNLYWDEQDRLRAVIRGNKVDYYAYDALGERIIKVKGSANSLHVNGGYVDGIGGIDEMVLYPNGYVTMNQNVPTKHYYADNQRIASRIGDPDSMGTVQGTNAVQNGTGNAENTAFMQQEIDKLFSTMGEDVTMEAMAGEPDCESELYHVKKILYNLDPEHPCLLLILKLEEQKMNPCEILEELEKEECYDPCEEEFQFWLDYLEEHNKLDCREQLYELYLSGNTKCDAILKMKEKGCLEIIIEIEEDCYQEFMAQYEYCLWTGDEECAEYFLGLLGGREQFEYCDLIEIIKEDHFYFPDTNIPEYPPVFPPAEEPEVEPEEPVEEIDPVVPQPPVIPGTPYIEGKIWWYHSDHLGSSSYLTDVNGLPTHYYGYLPFGEIMVEHNNSNYDNVYKFNGKELDESTGYYYYGARYYDPAISIFLSVDPLAEQFPNWNPYTYTMNNPVNLVDPTGMAPEGKDDWFVNKRTGNVVKIGGVSDLTNLSSDDVEKFGLGNVNDYNRLGKDDMFGDVGHPGLEGRVTDYDNLKMNSESENFMRNNGYYKAQSLLIEEKEMTSGGRMGNENFSQTTGSIKQLKTLGITYAKLNQFNEKSDIREDEFLGNNMFVKTATYTYTVGMNGSTQVTNPLYRSNQRGIPGTGNTVLNIAKGAVEALSDLIGIRKK